MSDNVKKWTAGPWHYDGKRVKAGSKTVADLRYENGRNDAHLILAAPDLYEALEVCEAWIRRYNYDDRPDLADLARAALAKARGEK